MGGTEPSSAQGRQGRAGEDSRQTRLIYLSAMVWRRYRLSGSRSTPMMTARWVGGGRGASVRRGRNGGGLDEDWCVSSVLESKPSGSKGSIGRVDCE